MAVKINNRTDRDSDVELVETDAFREQSFESDNLDENVMEKDIVENSVGNSVENENLEANVE